MKLPYHGLRKEGQQANGSELKLVRIVALPQSEKKDGGHFQGPLCSPGK